MDIRIPMAFEWTEQGARGINEKGRETHAQGDVDHRDSNDGISYVRHATERAPACLNACLDRDVHRAGGVGGI